jgi:hypothetical protein
VSLQIYMQTYIQTCMDYLRVSFHAFLPSIYMHIYIVYCTASDLPNSFFAIDATLPMLDFEPIVFVAFLLRPASHRQTCQARKESDLGVVAVAVGSVCVDETAPAPATTFEFAGAAAVVEGREHEYAVVAAAAKNASKGPDDGDDASWGRPWKKAEVAEA